MSHFQTRIHPYSLQVLCESRRVTKLSLMNFSNELLVYIIDHVPPPYFEFFVLTCKRIHELASKAIQEYNSIRRPPRTLSPYDLHREIVLNPKLALYPSSLSAWQSDRNFYSSLALIEKLPNLQRLEIRTERMSSLLDTVSYILLAYYEPGPRTLRHPLPLEMLRTVRIQDRELFIGDTTRTNDAMDLSVLLSMIPSVRKLHVSSLWTWVPYQCAYRCYNAGVTELDLEGRVDSNFAIDLICRTSNLQNFSYRHKIEYNGQPPTNFSPQRIVQFLQMKAGHSLTRLKLTISPQYPRMYRPNFRRNDSDLFVGSLRGLMTLKTLETSVDFLIRPQVVREERIHGSGKAPKLVKTMPPSLQILTLDQGLEEWDGLVIRQLFRDFSEDKERCLPSLTVVGFVHCQGLKALLSNHTIRECRSAGVSLWWTP